MYQVGTDAGYVHRQQQGTGLGTVIRQPGAEIGVAVDLAKERAALRAKRNAEKEAAKNAALKKLGEKPDWWYVHDSELKGDFTTVQQTGVDLIASGINDPFSSTDPRAVQFRKDFNRVQQLATSSSQLREQYTKLRTDIDGAGPDDFDDETIVQFQQFYEQPLNKIVNDGLKPPNLIKKRPYLDGFKFVGDNMATWAQGWNGNIPTEAQTFDFVKALVNDPANRDRVIRTYGSKLAQMDPEDRKDVLTRADQLSVDPHVVMAVDDANRWKARSKPFVLLDALQEAANTVTAGIDYKKSETPFTASKTFDVKDLDKSLSTVSRALFNQRPLSDWAREYEGKVDRLSGENDGEFAARIRQQIREDITPLVKTERSFEKKDKGQQREELATTRNQWIADLRSADPRLKSAAAQWITGAKLFQNLDVSGASVQQAPDGSTELEIVTNTPMTVKEVQDEIEGKYGAVKGDIKFEEVQGKKVFRIPIGYDEVANQYLARIYDTTFEQRDKQPYDTKISERTVPPTIDDALKGRGKSTPLAPSAAGELDNLFKNK